MTVQELTPVINHKAELILAFLDVINTTSPALAVVLGRYLLPEDSERSRRLQANLQLETFAELLTLWTQGIATEQLTQVLPYFLEILKHHLTEKGTDDYLEFDEHGEIPLLQSIWNYNEIASNLAAGSVSIEEAIREARQRVVTPQLQKHETDLTRLFSNLRGTPTFSKRIAMRLLDLRYSSRLDKRRGEMGIREALDDPNTFIMVANLHEIDHARKNIIDLDHKTDGRLRAIAEYTLQMLIARYTGGNNLLADVNASVQSALEVGTDTVLIGFTYGMGLLARASVDQRFLESIEHQQSVIIDAMTNAARVIREMNDASPTALTVWGERPAQAHGELLWLRQQIGMQLSPKDFFIALRKRAESNPEFQRYVDYYARQVVDAGQGEYNIGLFAASQFSAPNTWDSYIDNMLLLSPDYLETRRRLWEQLNSINAVAADCIGKMVGYHDGLYRFAKGDFDQERDIVELTMRCAEQWRMGFSEDKSEQLAVFAALRAEAVWNGEAKKAELLSGVLQTLSSGL